MQAINAANTGHSVITTIHANSCEDTYYRMVTLCKQEQPGMDDATLQNLATKHFRLWHLQKAGGQFPKDYGDNGM